MPDSRDKRRWWQFSLRTMLISCLILGPTIGLGWRYVAETIRKEQTTSSEEAYRHEFTILQQLEAERDALTRPIHSNK